MDQRGIISAVVRQAKRLAVFIPSDSMADPTVEPILGPIDSALTDDEIALIRSWQGVPLNAQYRVLTVEREKGPKSIYTLLGIVVNGKLIGRRANVREEADGSDAPDQFDEPENERLVILAPRLPDPTGENGGQSSA